MSRPVRVPMLIKIWLCLSVYGPLHLIIQASSQQVLTHVIAMRQVDKRPISVHTRGLEAMLARQEQDQPIVTWPDSPTVVALHPKALPVMLEVFTNCVHSTIDLAAS